MGTAVKATTQPTVVCFILSPAKISIRINKQFINYSGGGKMDILEDKTLNSQVVFPLVFKILFLSSITYLNWEYYFYINQ